MVDVIAVVSSGNSLVVAVVSVVVCFDVVVLVVSTVVCFDVVVLVVSTVVCFDVVVVVVVFSVVGIPVDLLVISIVV